jgi:hypothetical protein
MTKRMALSALTLMFLLVLGMPAWAQAPATFNITVYHGINGVSLGLSKDLPVEADVYKDGSLLATVPLNFKDTFNASLPPGSYEIKVRSVELGAEIPSMAVGPVMIPAGVDVFLHAKLSGNKTPVLKVKVD